MLLTHQQLEDANMRYARYTTPTGSIIVAIAGATIVACQYSDRYRDPRTGYVIRKREPLATSTVIYTEIWSLLADLSHAIRVDDGTPYDGDWLRVRAREEILYTYVCAAADAIAGDDLPTWSVVTDKDYFTQATSLPARKSKGKPTQIPPVGQEEAGTEVERGQE